MASELEEALMKENQQCVATEVNEKPSGDALDVMKIAAVQGKVVRTGADRHLDVHVFVKACFEIFYHSSRKRKNESHFNVSDRVYKLGKKSVETD